LPKKLAVALLERQKVKCSFSPSNGLFSYLGPLSFCATLAIRLRICPIFRHPLKFCAKRESREINLRESKLTQSRVIVRLNLSRWWLIEASESGREKRQSCSSCNAESRRFICTRRRVPLFLSLASHQPRKKDKRAQSISPPKENANPCQHSGRVLVERTYVSRAQWPPHVRKKWVPLRFWHHALYQRIKNNKRRNCINANALFIIICGRYFSSGARVINDKTSDAALALYISIFAPRHYLEYKSLIFRTLVSLFLSLFLAVFLFSLGLLRAELNPQRTILSSLLLLLPEQNLSNN